ncbi:hypothetical protein TWF106_006043 [Orbilia oligospora]|uniref:F-box domain-containing protein n=1 Tax=Orbilia oligospora TaxID=2813651 RepID=A0A6G1LR58_ORBOL|nr:hypothetical protein TWF106_006043 [Orbilia oligospora]KAF3197366.1 hypothetical protein TWF679_003236 [Orbilia oligospora]KAF3200819.1 hypothetical protein TWF191_003531 [Orbilia oligospora]KAF3230468.1 hypothetical protein TWF192_004675 [Orbilia oligospora]
MPSLPPELQLLILESSSPTQYPTLRLVSVFWKSKIDILKSLLYRAPPLITKPYTDWCTELIPPSSAPFLIHSALFNCTGAFHRTIDPKTKKIVLSGTKRPRKKYEIPSGLLETTQQFILYKNEPLIIPDTSTEDGLKPVERTIRLQYLMNRNCGASSTYQVLVQQGDVIGKERGMTLGGFEEWIRRFRAKRSLLMVPGEEGEKFVIQVGVESKSGVLTIHIEDLNRHR